MMIAPAASRQNARSPPQQRDYWSWSAISTYRTCPLKYFFRYVARLPEERVSASLVFGAGIHRAIEHHFRQMLAGDSQPALEELLHRYQQEWQARSKERIQLPKKETAATLYDKSRRLLSAFLDSEAAKPRGRILAIEEELRGRVIAGMPELLGKLDLVTETDDAVIVSDWKTSHARWSPFQVDDAREQLLLYAELVREFVPNKPVHIEVVVLTKTKQPAIDRYSVPVEPVRLDRLKRLVGRIWRTIQAKHFYPAPSLLACGGCPFRQPCQKWPG